MAKRIIYQSTNLQVVFQDFPTEYSFVTFNEFETTVNREAFWGDRFFEKLAISSIGVVTTEPNWYPAAQMREAIVAIRVALQDRKILTYGHSQGGYGALKYSNALGAKAAISFCPQISIDPAVVGHFDRRYTRHFIPELRNGLPIESADFCANNYIFYDPLEKHDLANVKLIMSLSSIPGQIRLMPTYFSGHATVRLLAEGRIGAEFIQSFCSDTPPSQLGLRRLLRTARTASKTYRLGRVRSLLSTCERHPGFLASTLPTARPEEKPLIKIILMLAQNQKKEADLSIQTFTDNELQPFDVVFMWNLFRRLKFRAGELRLAEAISRTHRANAFARLHAVNSFIGQKEHDRATQELQEILTLADAPLHADAIISFSRILKHPDLLSIVLIDKKFEKALDIRGKRLAVTLDCIELHWARNDRVRATKLIGTLHNSVILDRRYISQLIGGAANNDSAEYGYEVFEQFERFTIDEKHNKSVSRMELLELLSRKDAARARRRLERLLPQLGRDPLDWQYASVIFQRSGEVEKAVMLQRAAVIRGRNRPDTRVRLVSLYMSSHRNLRARYHLLVLSLMRSMDIGSLRTCVDMALRQRRFNLAIRFAYRWCKLANRDPEALMSLARSYSRKGNKVRSRAIALDVWHDPVAQQSLSDSLWHELVDHLYDPRAPHVAEAALSTGLQRFPQNGALQKLRKSSALISRFAVPVADTRAN